MTRQRGTRLISAAFAVVLGTSLAAGPIAPAALAQSVGQGRSESAGELVPMIQRSIQDIELELRLDPARAADSLARQKERLDTLRSEMPDHPMLPSLERRIDELDQEIADAREARPEAEEQFVPLSVPTDVRMQLRDVEELQTLGDREMMRGRMDEAAAHLEESAALLDSIEQDYGDRIPPAYAPLIVARERLSALQDQLDRRQAD